MKKWNTKINPKLKNEKSSETPNNDFQFSANSPLQDNSYRYIQKPRTARITSRNRNLKPGLIDLRNSQNSYRSTNQETVTNDLTQNRK